MRSPARILRSAALPMGIAAVASSLAAGAGDRAAPRSLSIVEPTGMDLLYSRTAVVADVADRRIREVRFFVEPFPAPFCARREAPWRCTFDAGVEFQGHGIRAEGFDDSGRRIAAARVDTLAYPRPVEVERLALTVPAVASAPAGASEAPDLGSLPLQCTFAGEPCEVVDARPVSTGIAEPVHLEILVDVSLSVENRRREIAEAVRYVIGQAPGRVRVGVSQFAGIHETLSPFTSDRGEAVEAVSKLKFALPYSCVLEAMRRSILRLQEQPGLRILFVVSDGEETCEILPGDADSGAPLRADPVRVAALEHEARGAGVLVYLFRLEGDSKIYAPGSDLFSGRLSGLARETGGLSFDEAGRSGIGAALRSVGRDVNSAWWLDVDLPAGVDTSSVHSLEILAPAESGIEIRYPSSWRAGAAEASAAAQLQAEDPVARKRAALRLVDARELGTLRAVIDAFAREADGKARLAQYAAINSMAAYHLLFGDVSAQREAIGAAEALRKMDPRLGGRLVPALRVYAKMSPPSALARRAAKLVE